jgi:hypothetical protein
MLPLSHSHKEHGRHLNWIEYIMGLRRLDLMQVGLFKQAD